MFSDSFIILRKELKRMFTDRRLLFMLVILPLIMLPLMYSFMGRTSKARQSEISQYTSRIAILSQQGSEESTTLFLASLAELNTEIVIVQNDEFDVALQQVTDKDVELFIVMPEGMDQNLDENTVFDFTIYHNSTADYSDFAFSQVQLAFSAVSEAVIRARILDGGLSEDILTVFTINNSLSPEVYDLAKEGSVMGKIISMMLPFFIVIYLFANSMKVGLDSVAGEKERGTLAILLVNQVSRLSIVLGKMMAVMIAAIVGAISSAIGLKIASRYLISMYSESSESIAEYTMGTTALFQFAIVVVPLAILISSLVLVVSTFAKNVKEGQGMIMPVYLAVMVMGMTTMQLGDTPPEWMRITPLFNSLVVLKDIFMQTAAWGNIVYAMVTSLLVAAGLIFVTLKMFNDERVLFRI